MDTVDILRIWKQRLEDSYKQENRENDAKIHKFRFFDIGYQDN